MDSASFIPAAIGWILAIAVIIFVLVTLARSIRIIPQATAGVVERLGRYHKTLMPGLNLLVPFVDRLRPLIDLREQVVSFPPQPVITEDNLVVSIDTVVYFQVTDARAATYEIANYLGAVEQLTTTTLRNVVGGLNLEEALTSRDNINGQLRVVLDEATGKWGIRVGRVELKAIDPPHSIQDSMEKQMRAERDRRAVILTAEGTKQSQILEAEGQRQAAILEAEGEKQAAVLRAQGEAKAIQNVFNAIHQGQPDDKLLAYQYLQTLPKIGESASNKLWIIPSEFTEALKNFGGAFAPGSGGSTPFTPKAPVAPPARRRVPPRRGRRSCCASPGHRRRRVTHPYFQGASAPRVLAHRGLLDRGGRGLRPRSTTPPSRWPPPTPRVRSTSRPTAGRPRTATRCCSTTRRCSGCSGIRGRSPRSPRRSSPACSLRTAGCSRSRRRWSPSPRCGSTSTSRRGCRGGRRPRRRRARGQRAAHELPRPQPSCGPAAARAAGAETLPASSGGRRTHRAAARRLRAPAHRLGAPDPARSRRGADPGALRHRPRVHAGADPRGARGRGRGARVDDQRSGPDARTGRRRCRRHRHRPRRPRDQRSAAALTGQGGPAAATGAGHRL